MRLCVDGLERGGASMDILGWFARAANSKAINILNKIWIWLTVVMIILMVAGPYIRSDKNKAQETPTAKTATQ
jgi:preprotein translocase subunit SecG